MEWTTTTIALTGFIVGVLSNPIPFVGGIAINFLVTSLLLAYQSLAIAVDAIPEIPTKIYIFALAYAVGIFIIKFLALLPIPYVQQGAQMLKGGN